MAENITAAISPDSIEKLKNPDSFILREAYYNESIEDDGKIEKDIVLRISGQNGLGGITTSYWLYSCDEEANVWVLLGSVSDLEREEYNDYDDTDDIVEKMFDNINRAIIIHIVENGVELSKNAIQRINTMFKNGTLDSVVLIEPEQGIQNEAQGKL